MGDNSSGANISGLGADSAPSGGIAYERMARDNGASEFSWGAGLDCPGFEHAPPSEGGRYKGQSPPTDLVVGVGRNE
jgi:hypothetical protein